MKKIKLSLSKTKIMTLFIGISFLSGCVDSSKQQQVNEVNTYYDLVALQNKDLADHIKKMETSKDPSLDIDDTVKAAEARNKIIIAGDSWAVFPCVHKSMTKALKQRNSSLVNDGRCLRTSKLGIEAREWLGSNQDKRLKKYLKINKEIKYIYLSLGGNDLMSTWNKDFTAEQEEKLFNETFNHIKNSIKQYIAIRPDIKVILAGYDYPHFKANHPIPMYKKIYENMGKPSDLVINEGLSSFTRHMAHIADFKNIFYIHHLGLSQYYDGVPERIFPPRVTLPPDQISPFNNPAAIGGDTQHPSSEKSMIDWLWFIYDAFHLSERNYDRALLHTFDNVLSQL